MNQSTALSPQQQGYNNISTALRSEKAVNRISAALGIDLQDENAKAEVVPYTSSVLMEIERNFGDSKKDLSTCQPESIVQCVVDAARMKIFIDNRQHAHLVKYGNKATLQIGYRGYVHKIKEHFPDADFSYGAIYEGDTFKINSQDGFDHYTLDKADAFEDDENKLKGIFVAISYTLGGVPKQKVTTLSKAMITKIRSSAKQDYIWKSWFIEKAIAAAIKRACKVHFASIKELKAVADFDNEAHFKPFNNQTPTTKASNPFETMNKIAQGEDIIEQEAETPEESAKDIDPPKDLFDQHGKIDIKKAIQDAVENINDQESYTAFLLEFEEDLTTLSEEEQASIKIRLKEIQEGLGIT